MRVQNKGQDEKAESNVAKQWTEQIKSGEHERED